MANNQGNVWTILDGVRGVPRSQSASTAAGLNLPAQPLSPQIFTQNVPPPDLTLDQIAMSPTFNLSAQQLQDMHAAANIQQGAQIAEKMAAGFGASYAFPAGLPREAAHAAGALYDLYDGSQFQQDAQDRYNDMLSQQLNDMLSQRLNNGQLPQGNWGR